MGLITTIDDTKTCRTSYEELLLKEVILAYCGTSEPIDIEIPSKPDEPTPPIITDPEIPEEPEIPVEPEEPEIPEEPEEPEEDPDYYYGDPEYPRNPDDPGYKGEPPAPDSPSEGDNRILGYKWESTPYGFGWNNPAVEEVLISANKVFSSEAGLIQGVLNFARDYYEADERFKVENYPSHYDYTVDFGTLKIEFDNELSYPDKNDYEGLRASKSVIRSYVRPDFCHVPGSDKPSVISKFSQYALIKVNASQNGETFEIGGTLNLGVAILCNQSTL